MMETIIILRSKGGKKEKNGESRTPVIYIGTHAVAPGKDAIWNSRKRT